MKKYAVLLLPLILISCVKEPVPVEIESVNSMDEVFPEGFDFETSQHISLTIKDVSVSGARYSLDYTMDGVKYDLGAFTKQPNATQIETTIPTAVKTIVLKKDIAGSTKNYKIEINNSEVEFDISNGQAGLANSSQVSLLNAENDCAEHLYAVNGSRDFFTIDLTGDSFVKTDLADLAGGGSIACALDQTNNKLYYNVGKNLYEYDIASQNFSIKYSSNPYNGNYPRFEYYEGFFYMSNGTTMYKVDAGTNEVVANYSINGFINSSGGGDLAFDSNGELYLACFSGLYKFTEFNDRAGTAQIIRVSAENFPFQLTSMAIDRQDRIFVGTNDANSNLIQISKEDGSYSIVKTFDTKINDLTAWRCATEDLDQLDSDNDGVIDELDDYPNDPDAATDTFTPSALGMGTFAYEDFWPLKGDYDFNDCVIGYRFTNVQNSANESVRLKMDFTLRAVGAGFHNGFGIELDVDPNLIGSVTGHSTSGANTTLNSIGLEVNQDKAVIIVFNDAFNHMNAAAGEKFINTDPNESLIETVTFEVIVEFINPITLEELGQAPFNPFIFSSTERGKEIHLPGKPPTSLADLTLFGKEDDDSDLAAGKTYQNSSNLPWAIHIIHQFRYPHEKVKINIGYNKFVDWALSNGFSYSDWYSDNNGYRNVNKLYFDN